jgi:Protein of unknown function (DUF2490)
LFFVAGSCVLSVSAQQAAPSNSDLQFWPEVDVSIKLNGRVSLLCMGTVHLGKNVSDLNDEETGVGLNFKLNKYFSLTPSYRHVRQQPPGLQHTREHRFFLDFTARLPLKDKWVLSDRNRGELRRVNGLDSHRYRNRLQLERSISIGERRITPYLADEVFYDDRHHIWNRNRFYAGLRIPFNEHFGIEAYYLEQHDVRDRPFVTRHVIGLNLKLDY